MYIGNKTVQVMLMNCATDTLGDSHEEKSHIFGKKVHKNIK